MANSEQFGENPSKPTTTPWSTLVREYSTLPTRVLESSTDLFLKAQKYAPSANLRYLIFTGAFILSAIDTTNTVQQILASTTGGELSTRQEITVGFAISTAAVWATISLEKFQRMIDRTF